jgi:elongator complex protein 2
MGSPAYIAASANRFYSVADVSTSSLVAFGSGRFVALWDVVRRPHRNLP